MVQASADSRMSQRRRPQPTGRVVYARVAAPIGGLASPVCYIAATPHGAIFVSLTARSDSAFKNEIADRYGPWLGARLQPATPSQTDWWRCALADWFRTGVAPPLDLTLLTPFQRQVSEAARRIPRGQTVSYGELAAAAGHPGAARAVGQVMAHNPLPLFIPCHRVVMAGGALGHYSGGGPAIKRRLLELEGAEGSPKARGLKEAQGTGTPGAQGTGTAGAQETGTPGAHGTPEVQGTKEPNGPVNRG